MFSEGHSAASDPPEGLAQGLLDALDSGQRTLHGQLVTGVQRAPEIIDQNVYTYRELTKQVQSVQKLTGPTGLAEGIYS